MKNLYKYNNQEFFDNLNKSVDFHKDNCKSFKKFLKSKNFKSKLTEENIEDFPYIHVSVFKRYSENLISIPNNEIVKKLSSSATSGIPSTIYLNKNALKSQSKMMGDIMKDYLGKTRRPMIIYDIEPKRESLNDIGDTYVF